MITVKPKEGNGVTQQMQCGRLSSSNSNLPDERRDTVKSVWAILPTARPAGEADKVFEMWIDMGYRICAQVDPGLQRYQIPDNPAVIITRPFLGWAESINHLSKFVLNKDPSCDWVVAIGDDCLPDLSHSAHTIAEECSRHFGGTYGVMNPTGDRYADGVIDTSAAHPWLGREFCRRVYGGKGPLWPEYRYWFGDTELQQVAIKLGVFWQRRDLKQEHRHWERDGREMPPYTRRDMPLVVADEALYEARKLAGFPGHEPLGAL